MIIVPIAGDKIETSGGLPGKVLSYTNYKSEGPAVIVEPSEGVSQETVYFKDIASINGRKVQFIKNGDGYKVFQTDGYIERKYQLPQPDDVIKSSISGIEQREYTVRRLRLHVVDQLSKGLLINAENKDTDEEVILGLNDIEDIEQTIFSREKFLSFYADYAEKGK